MEKQRFDSLGLSPEILKAVAKLGYEEATPIQSAAIPVLLEGCDLVGQSQTGSGKTAAFAIPAIEKVDPDLKAVQVLILCPTRELAEQVASEIHQLTSFKRGIGAVPIYGGASYDRQLFELRKGTQIVIGTPGRLMDHLERGTLKLDQLKVVILDEADRMLDMGFRDDIARILESAPEERQTVFFSATLSREIRELINRHSRDPRTVAIERKDVTAPAIEQWFYEVPPRFKTQALIRLVDYHGFRLGIIFCNTQRMVDDLADALLAQGFSADRLHGGISQAQRTRVMGKFRNSEFEFLVATDVAARGIDVDHLEVVINYDLPPDPEDYVHRIGRTGRAGRKGMAATLVSGRDLFKIQYLEKFTHSKIRRGVVPSPAEIEGRKSELLLGKVRELLESGNHAPQDGLVERLLEEGFQSTEICSALFSMLLGQSAGAPSAANAPSAEAPNPQKPVKREEYGPATDEELGEFGRRAQRHGGGPANGPGVPSEGKPPFANKKGFKPGPKKAFDKPFKKPFKKPFRKG
jgi:ATP-dependent RNA helicase DeaD